MTDQLDNTRYLAGYTIMPLVKPKLDEYINACIAAGVTYGLGAKDPTPAATLPIDFKEIDCSGFVRELIRHASNGLIVMPDGSYNQGPWLTEKGYKRSDYASTGLVDTVVRIAVYANPSGVGHVYLTYQGKSYESHGGVGPSHRAWDHPTLKAISPHTTYWAVA